MLFVSLVAVSWVFGLPGLLSCSVNAQSPPSNLPDLPPGVFSAQASAIIDAPLQDVWDVILDFPSYPEWNPFARSMVVADSLWIPLEDQTAEEARRLIIQAQIPPLPTPVNKNTPPNPLHAQTSFENITTIDTVNWRAAWREIMLPQPLLDAERWQALSTLEDGTTYYESKEVFYGPVGYVVDALFSEGVQEGFTAQAGALKERVEASGLGVL